MVEQIFPRPVFDIRAGKFSARCRIMLPADKFILNDRDTIRFCDLKSRSVKHGNIPFMLFCDCRSNEYDNMNR